MLDTIGANTKSIESMISNSIKDTTYDKCHKLFVFYSIAKSRIIYRNGNYCFRTKSLQELWGWEKIDENDFFDQKKLLYKKKL